MRYFEMRLDSHKVFVLILFLLPNVLQAVSAERCAFLNKQIAKFKEQFNEPDETIIQRYKENIQRQLTIFAEEISSSEKKHANTNQLLNESRKDEEMKIAAYTEFLANEEKKLDLSDDVLLKNKKKNLQIQISIADKTLTQRYQEELTKKPDEKIIKNPLAPDTKLIEKNLNELLQVQLLPDAELLKKAKTEMQDSMNTVKKELEAAKEMVKSDELLIKKGQQDVDEALKYFKEARERLQQRLTLPDEILLRDAKNDIQRRFHHSLKSAAAEDCPINEVD